MRDGLSISNWIHCSSTSGIKIPTTMISTWRTVGLRYYAASSGGAADMNQGDDGEYGMYGKDGEFWGFCTRPDDPQYLDCTTAGLYNIFHCQGGFVLLLHAAVYSHDG